MTGKSTGGESGRRLLPRSLDCTFSPTRAKGHRGHDQRNCSGQVGLGADRHVGKNLWLRTNHQTEIMEVDFNSTNKIIYGQRMLQTVRRYKLMPEEIYSKKNCLAEDETLVKVLFYDIVRQTRLPARIGAMDMENCYDRIAHPIALMVFQSLGVHKEACKSTFSSVQDMKFFLRMGFGDSKKFASTRGSIKTQGMCQGNGAALAGIAS
jgi:hypothetical protein